MRLTGAALLGVIVLGGGGVGRAAGSGPRRVAVIVGANASAPGRQPLLYSHRDAQSMAEILVEVGGFRREDLQVLEDPTPAEVLAAVAAAGASTVGHRDSLLYFYYSGHADERSLYPAGQALPLEQVRGLIDAAPAAVRIGMVDACRGGAWTRAKGLSPDQAFAVQWPVSLGNEGSVLIASSSGLESAHEADHLRGSFFTTHFVVGLRGAADRDGNGEVTLTEAFEYARERTIRDSARLTRETQHPSYAVTLRGRRDLVLAQVARGLTTMEIAQEEGPLTIINLESGLELLELAPGHRGLRLAVPPGRYLVRKTGRGGQLIKEVAVAPGSRIQVAESELTLVSAPPTETKGVDRRARPIPFRRLLVPFVMMGAGWTSGQPEVNPTDATGRRIALPWQDARVGLLTVGVEMGFRVWPRVLVGVQARHEIITQGTPVYDPSCPGADHSCPPPRGASALLAKGTTWFQLSPQLALLVSASAGAGTVRHVVVLPTVSDCGLSHTEPCVDTLASGPWLLGSAVAVMYDIGGPFALQASLGALLGFPRTAIDSELATGLAVKF